MYENGLGTRAKIIACAKELFWQKGYRATGYRDISAANGMSPGLLHYHFGKKQLLGYTIYIDIIKAIEEIVDTIAPEADTLLQTTIISTVIWLLVGQSEEFARFMYDISIDRIPVVDGADSDIYQYRKTMEAFTEGTPGRDFEVRLHMAFAGERELLIDYASGSFDLDSSDCAALDSEMSLQLMGVPKDVIDRLVSDAEALVSAHEIHVHTGFEIVLVR